MMQVFVYPEIFCRRALVPVFGPHLGYRTRWHLLPPRAELPPVTPLPEGPRPPVEPILERILPDEGVYHIRAALWKQSDGYFVGDRYNPAGITGYNVQYDFSVDEADTGVPGPTDQLKVYCAPGYAPHPDPSDPDNPCVVPQHESENVELIVLEPVLSSELVREVAPSEELGSKPVIAKRGGD